MMFFFFDVTSTCQRSFLPNYQMEVRPNICCVIAPLKKLSEKQRDKVATI